MHRSRFRPLVMTLLLVATGLLGASACQPPQPSAAPDLDGELRAVIAAQGLSGDPSAGQEFPSIDDPLAQLGMGLFFSKALGGDQDSACVSCHHPLLGGGDRLSLSIGVGAPQPDLLGPGRSHPDGGPTVPRNAPTTFNVGLYQRVLFHDGRIEALGETPGQMGIRTPDSPFGLADPQAGPDLVSAQSRFPIASPEEMRGFTFEAHRPNRYVRAHLVDRLAGVRAGVGELPRTDWAARFEALFGSGPDGRPLISDATVAVALGAYQRSQVFVDSPWKAYVQGDDDAISQAAKRGALLFLRPAADGGAGCARCHQSDCFTDEQFHVLAMPQVGPGKGDGPFNDDDYGRFRETGRPEDLYAFRTPSLLNVEVTGPYGHAGAYTTLEGVIRHHLDPAGAIAAYQPSQLDPSVQREHLAANTARAVAQLEEARRQGRLSVERVSLSSRQVFDLVSFLLALTDPCVKDPACLAPWIPDETDPDPDGLRLRAVIADLGKK